MAIDCLTHEDVLVTIWGKTEARCLGITAGPDTHGSPDATGCYDVVLDHDNLPDRTNYETLSKLISSYIGRQMSVHSAA